MQEQTSSLYDQSKGLSNLDIQNYFQKHNIPYHEIDSMDKIGGNRKNQAVVYTGYKKDDANNGVTKHWLYLAPNRQSKLLFDSYGDPNAYNKDYLQENNIKFPNRKQLQAWNTNTCGEYVSAYAQHLNENPQLIQDPEELTNTFIQRHHLTKNKIENDKKIKAYYDETK
jgi:hypothetical protein